MEAISKKTGKVFTGKVAALMLRIGVAAPAEGYVKPVKVQPKKKAAPRKKAQPKVKK